MKKSLTWRWIVIGLVILAWGTSLFPLRDRSFMDVFEKRARSSVASYVTESARKTEKAAALETKLADLDKGSDAYAKTLGKIETLKAEAAEATRLAEAFDGLMARTKAQLADATRLVAPDRALLDAARGGVDHKRVILRDYMDVPGLNKPSNKQVIQAVRRKASGRLHLGLDLRGGTEFYIGFDPSEIEDPQPGQVEAIRDQIMEILRRRVDVLGLVEPEIKTVGPSAISLRMPMVTESQKASVRETIKQSARLEFYLVDPQNAVKVAEYEADPASFTPTPGYEYAEIEEEADGQINTRVVFIKKNPERLKGQDIDRAGASPDEFGRWQINLRFKAAGAAEFARITRENEGRQLAIVMDGKVYSAPQIKEAITMGSAQITGNFTVEEARRLAGVISSGNLPVKIRIDSEFGTDPTLGRDSVRSGVLAAVIGMALVVVFMLVYYRFSGAVAIAALTCNMLLVMGTLALFRATLTLPGIAGIVLTIGMAVDANVLIFERIREELATGKTIGNALRAGYERAFVTILDSNLTTLLTAYILYKAGSGPVRGFAVTLSIGIIASMFTALFMTRCIFDTGIFRGMIKRISMMSLPFLTNANYNFLGMRKVTATISIALMVIGIGAALVRGTGALSIDFAGGTQVSYGLSADSEPAVRDVRGFLAEQGFTDARVLYKESPIQLTRVLEVTLPHRSTDESSLDLEGLEKGLNTRFADAAFKQIATNSVGPQIGREFTRKAVWAAVLAICGIILYISFRFEFAYGIAAVAALVHDVTICTGLYIICGRQLSLPVVAALLTIIGYSLNDTIVVFDRIREDLALEREGSYAEIINLSINQTLSRTTLTSLTTLFVVLTLFVFGGGAINDFALVMLFGVVVGTYSSIFIASAIVAVWHKRSRRHAEEAAAAASRRKAATTA